MSAVRVVPRAGDDGPHPAAVVSPRSRPDVAALVAGVLTSSMALYHFTLPATFHWGQALEQAPTLRWGLSLINASFSFLLLVGGAMTIAIAFAPSPRERASTWVLGGMAAYWIFNIAWQLIDPMPLPRQLLALRLAFPAFSAMLVALYAVALLRPRARRVGLAAAASRPAGGAL